MCEFEEKDSKTPLKREKIKAPFTRFKIKKEISELNILKIKM